MTKWDKHILAEELKLQIKEWSRERDLIEDKIEEAFLRIDQLQEEQ